VARAPGRAADPGPRTQTEDYVGRCQACLGEYKVDERAKVVLHGYLRPGDGYIRGECEGVGAPPLEHSCELTKAIAARHATSAAGWRTRLRELGSASVARLTRTWEEYEGDGPIWSRKAVRKHEEIGPDHEDWDRTLAGAIRRAEFEERLARAAHEYYSQVVAQWRPGKVVGVDTPATGRPRGALAPAWDPGRETERAAREAAKAERDAKPGKLRLVLWRQFREIPAPARGDGLAYDRYRRAAKERDAEVAEWVAQIRQWAKSAFPEGKQRTGSGSQWDLPNAVRAALRDDGRFLGVAVVHLDWRYRDEAEQALRIPAARQQESPKRMRIVAEDPGGAPWSEPAPGAAP
jgi:hypothetical protein